MFSMVIMKIQHRNSAIKAVLANSVGQPVVTSIKAAGPENIALSHSGVFDI